MQEVLKFSYNVARRKSKSRQAQSLSRNNHSFYIAHLLAVLVMTHNSTPSWHLFRLTWIAPFALLPFHQNNSRQHISPLSIGRQGYPHGVYLGGVPRNSLQVLISEGTNAHGLLRFFVTTAVFLADRCDQCRSKDCHSKCSCRGLEDRIGESK